MRFISLIASILLITSIGCGKEEKGCVAKKPEAEEPQILAYLSNNNINAVKHPSGIYYVVQEPGSGVTPTINSRVYVTYTGKLLNGNVFDQSTNTISFNLYQVIEGWQIGIPLIKKGGKIKLIIPSALAYGCNGVGSIPPNSVLQFDVSLSDVQ